MATHSSILACKILWTDKPGGLQSMGSQRVGHDWAASLSLAWNVPLVSLIFLKRCLVFPILLFSSVSFHWSLRKVLSLLVILCNFSFKRVYLSFSSLPFTSLLFSAICKASSDNHFAFWNFFFLGIVLIPSPVQCYEHLSIVLQALCVSDIIPWIYFSLPLYNHEGCDLDHTWMV